MEPHLQIEIGAKDHNIPAALVKTIVDRLNEHAQIVPRIVRQTCEAIAAELANAAQKEGTDK